MQYKIKSCQKIQEKQISQLLGTCLQLAMHFNQCCLESKKELQKNVSRNRTKLNTYQAKLDSQTWCDQEIYSHS